MIVSEKMVRIEGKEKGPVSVILAGVHGDEKCGVRALKKLLPTFKIDKGVVFLGYGNPRAIKVGKRFTEANLNRMFKDGNSLSAKDRKSYEYRRAQFLKKYLKQADALLDIHASSNKKSRVFIICERNARPIIVYLPTNLVVSGFDRIQPGGTDYYMNSIGKIGICIECGFLGNPRSTQIAEKSIFSFLMARGHIKLSQKPRAQSLIRIYKMYMTKTNKFTLSKAFKDFERVKKGTVIGVDGKIKVCAPKDGIVVFAKNQKRQGEEAFLLGEFIS